MLAGFIPLFTHAGVSEDLFLKTFINYDERKCGISANDFFILKEVFGNKDPN